MIKENKLWDCNIFLIFSFSILFNSLFIEVKLSFLSALKPKLKGIGIKLTVVLFLYKLECLFIFELKSLLLEVGNYFSL